MVPRGFIFGFLTLEDWTDRFYFGFLTPEVGTDRFYFGFLTPEDGTVRLSRNVGMKLPLLAA
jgi:hypothetical protein